MSAVSLVQPGITGLSHLAVWSALNSQVVSRKGAMSIIGSGALAQVTGSYLYDHVIVPLLM